MKSSGIKGRGTSLRNALTCRSLVHTMGVAKGLVSPSDRANRASARLSLMSSGHFFRDEDDPERKAYALPRPSLHAVSTRFTHLPVAPMSDDELTELVTLTLCEMKERVSGRSDLQTERTRGGNSENRLRGNRKRCKKRHC